MRNNIKSPTKHEEWIIKFLILLALFSVVHFLFFFFQPGNRGNILLYILLCITLLYSIFKKLYMWYNYANISVPEKPKTSPVLSVDILTTYFPGEPHQMIVTTLEAITKITYPHTAYLCDEANDPYLKRFCEENGIIHVTRDNRKDAKAGNINNALRTVARGEICVVLDPDHIPDPDFLDPIVPFFSNEEIGFVQIVQSYYNIKETLVAKGAAEQTFQFYGPMMMTLHSYGTVNAIGANCVFRRKALDSIGGHAPGLCEDMHTAMLLYAKGWKSVYLPEVLAKGLAPSNLTNYFKQQLKWARGTFDLLFKVYPRVFKHLTTRQRIHFGILPLHYLSGVMYLINFLIPILALFFSITPWKGNIVDFILSILPLAFSALLIRAFVQKWVIEKEERGFHLTGGLLQINTWWVYILGFIYTIFNKKVPYLPTPKHSEFNTNLKIILPNAAVALISVIAIIYGLRRDFTPFSIFMAGFAFFNTCIMMFGIYLSIKATNQNRILRSSLHETTVKKLYSFKESLRSLFHTAFTFTRRAALPLLAFILVFALGFKQYKNMNRWQNVQPGYLEKTSGTYLGIFNPSQDDGLVDIDEISSIEARENINFDIVSFYLAWGEQSLENFPEDLLETLAAKNAIPMITWEPWASGFSKNEEISDLKDERKIFKYIAEGVFDDYVESFADKLVQYDNPIFLRFAHEFDNPQYPWSHQGGNSPAEFKAAWKHIHSILKARGAHEVMLVWNPWKPERMEQYYPGDKYVDWVGLTILNYQELNEEGKEIDFDSLYRPFKEKLYWFTRKPIMLAEFGSLDLNGNRQNWIKDAMSSIAEDQKLSAVVLFNSAYDKNFPQGKDYNEKYLDWTLDSIQIIRNSFPGSYIISHPSPPLLSMEHQRTPLNNIRGVRYKKSENWRDNYYVVTRENLVEDLKKIKAAGMNTLMFKGGNVYEYNLLKYTQDYELKVVYEFDIDLSTSFINNNDQKKKLEKEVLSKVKHLKMHPHIIGFSFNYNAELFFTKPLLFYQQEAYIDWLHYLMKEVKNLDPEKALIMNLPLKDSSLWELKKIDKSLPIDAYGLILKDTLNLKNVLKKTTEENIPVFLSSLPAEILRKNEDLTNGNVILENWQDERYSYRLSFDGLLDFEGRMKKSYYLAEDLFRVPKDRHFPSVRILKPAVALLPGQKVTYKAVINLNGDWKSGSLIPEDYIFEWKLIKNDIFGNPLAAKDLGEGEEINLVVPAKYENYQLLLSVTQKDSHKVVQSKESLHIPIYQISRY